MRNIIVGFIIIICVGCQSVKQPSEELNSSTEAVFITIKKVESAYEPEVKFVLHKSFEQDSGIPEYCDVLTIPKIEIKPNDWAVLRSGMIPNDYASSTKIMLNGEMVEIPGGYGLNLKIKVTPNGDSVHAKGVFSVAKEGEFFDVPFSGDFELGTPTIVYERKECFGSNAYTNVVKK